MSFRRRLTLFFLLLVIVPMLSVTVVVFRLIDDNETGKADAHVAEGQLAAIGVYRREAQRADEVVRDIGQDQTLTRALRARDRAATERRAHVLVRSKRLARLAVDLEGHSFVVVGTPTAVAPASLDLIGAAGVRTGRLRASVLTSSQYAVLVRRVTGLDAVIRRDGTQIVATLPGFANRDLPEVGTITSGGTRYRVASFTAPAFDGGRLRISVAYDAGKTSSEIASSRLIAGLVLVGFLVLAFAFAITVSRSLQAEIARFLEAARRLGSGDFSTIVPTVGHDEFAGLGDEFNKMSRQLETRLEELRQERARLEESIRRIGDTFASNLDRDALLEIVVRTTVDAVGATCGRATVRDDLEQPLEQRAAVGELGDFEEVILRAEEAALGSGLPAELTLGERSALSFPLRPSDGRERVVGLVSIARAGQPFTQRERELFNYVAAQAGVSIENVDLHELVQQQAVTDELTGLFNRRRFEEVIAGEVERARRFDQPLGFVMLDLDDFKHVNDTYGHQQGDVVLREVARVLRESSREIDEPARYGGEELAVALPQTDLDGAYRLAERVREAIAKLELPRINGAEPLRVTASFGVSAIPDSAGDADSLIAAADQALYRAKRAGKNRTERAIAGEGARTR